MKQQKYYRYLQKQILLMIGLSIIPGFVYVVFGWLFNVYFPAALWYISLLIVSSYGWSLYKEFADNKMNETQLSHWHTKMQRFMYVIFSSWTVIFILYIGHDENNLHYIAIFTQLGAAVVASTLLVSDKKLFVPILFTLMLPLTIYFFLVDTWYGYVLSIFSLIFLAVLLYASSTTYKLIQDNYFQAQHDVLTGLYNRRYFMEYMESLQERLIETSDTAYLFLIDLDHFKTINDSLGHDVGDKLLIEVSRRIEEYIGDIFTLARLGGDEFILVSKEYDTKQMTDKIAYGFAEGLLQVIREAYHVDKHHLHISASIGVHRLNPSSLLHSTNFIKEVDIALYEAKAQGRDGVIIFNKDLEERVERHLLIEQKLYHAIKENKIKVYYQPQFDKQTKLLGCEALVRWHDSELGNLSPEEFIPISENTGLIIELGSYVLKETFKVLHSWNEKGKIIQNFAINISIRQLTNDSFTQEIESLMSKYFPNKNPAQKIFFEITEHVFAEDMRKVILTMNRLKELGIYFSIDDFGTGYSSLSYLRELPIDEVKIDKAFISQLDKSIKSENMISTIITIAKNFDLNVVAEGIETAEQLDFLIKNDCDACQGFYFEEALPQHTFEEKYIFI